MIVREIGKPMPMPFGLVVKKESKMCASLSAGIPWAGIAHGDLDFLAPLSAAVTLIRRSPRLRLVQRIHSINYQVNNTC